MSTTLNRKKSLYLQIGEESREYVVEFPNTGKMMDIDLLKIQLSDGKYDTLKYSFNIAFQKSANRIDTIATFNTLLPKLKADLNAKSFLDLTYEQMELVEIMYVEQFLPWYEEWLVKLAKPKEEPKEEKTEA